MLNTNTPGSPSGEPLKSVLVIRLIYTRDIAEAEIRVGAIDRSRTLPFQAD